uniref:Uncharacterized protein n=1 Tax=Tanacetum cinerariifolium TaxID=118510 RepID=A0A6L2J8J6_TANCI|nr:hypothetical protein [Tanacetum cinerariifolium]
MCSKVTKAEGNDGVVVSCVAGVTEWSSLFESLNYEASTRTSRLIVAIGYLQKGKIIMVSVIPSNRMDEVPVVEPNQHEDVFVVPEPVLVDEDEDSEEDKFEEEEDPQEKMIWKSTLRKMRMSRR